MFQATNQVLTHARFSSDFGISNIECMMSDAWLPKQRSDSE